MFRFESLQIWQDAIKLNLLISKQLKTVPDYEQNALVDQLRRAVLSISLNIAEGSGSDSKKDFKRHLIYSIKSAYETASIIIIARELNYFSTNEFARLHNEIDILIRKIRNFIKVINNSREPNS